MLVALPIASGLSTSLPRASSPPSLPFVSPCPPSPCPPPQGYNSGLNATSSFEDEGVNRQLSPDSLSDDDEVAPLGLVDEDMFNDGLGLAGKELLEAGVAGMMDDINGVLPYFAELAVSAE